MQTRVLCAIVSGLLAMPAIAIAGAAQHSAMPSIAPQSEAAPRLNPPVPQPLASPAPTLELNPQPAASARSPGADELPVDREFKQAEQRAALDRNFHPQREQELYRASPPYLGIQVQYTSKCFMGMEEHGLEVINVQPKGPAAQAGLQAKDQAPAPNVPSDHLIDLLHRRIGEAREGDLIVAVDDVRVHGRADWENAIRKLKPGDTMYLTVVRPETRKTHRTMRIAIKVGRSSAAKMPAPVPPIGSLAETGTFSY